jgi:intracellular sulfur oxidation DsrE/DsrF family protein
MSRSGSSNVPGETVMTIRVTLFLLAALVALTSIATAQQAPGFWTTPAIKGYGPVHAWPEATLRPDTATTYKAVFDLTKGGSDTGLNNGLSHIARAINAFAAAGVATDHLQFTVIVHGPATPVVLDAKNFQAKFNHANPNLAVIDALKQAGVRILVCGNALGDFGYTPSQVNPNIQVAWAALSTVIMLQNQGYALLQM